MIRSIVITPEARQSFIEETLKFKKLETGGVLCGSYQGDQLVVTSASGPGPDAVHAIDEFIIDKDYMDAYLDAQYDQSGGMHIYIGEWHTHPQVNPEPSEQDLISICERSIEWQHGEIVFLIIGFLNFSADSLAKQIFGIHYDKEKQSFYQLPIQIQ
ncbi:MAG TPA: Mov34/MPN/PAD-1 family protein [Flavisolibacter sp.]|nr:Mov34/MPN/PAD-1 family protein [Flavisolibacter sp.]